MQLLRLEMKGFKSFADKTIVEFSKGLTGIVGPNGSGKSNITDAIRWVLGESNVRHLRGQKAEDVIFSGTEGRRPLSTAEVTIVLDNSDKTLPNELEEVAIARRIYRSGDSEFFINKRNCRMKDIHQLLADTGLGRDSMAIIGQNRVDAILNSKPEERRVFFEDIAGISGYKMNKEDSERRLQATERNMQRLADIIATVETQLDELEKKAETTRTYNALAKEKREYEGLLAYHRYITAEEVRKKVIGEQETLEQELGSMEQTLSEMDEKRNQALASSEEIEQRIRELEVVYAKALEKKAEIEGQRQVWLSKEMAIKETLAEKNRHKEEWQAAVKADESRILVAKKTIQEETLKQESLSKRWEEVKSTYEKKEAFWKDLCKKWEEQEANKEALRLEKETLLQSVEKLKASLEVIDREHAEKSRLDEALALEVEEVHTYLQQEKEAFRIYREEYAWQEAQVAVYEKMHKEKTAAIDVIRKELQRKMSDKQRIEGRLQILEQWKLEHEGLGEPTKAVLLAKAPWHSGMKGAVGELFYVDKTYSLAIEIALGQAIHQVVCETKQQAEEAIAYLKKANKGRVTFMPLDSLVKRTKDGDVVREKGILGLAHTYITYDALYAPVFEQLLGRTYIAENLESAFRAQKNHRGRLRIVTLQGELLQPGGAVTGGSIRRKKGALFSRQEEETLLVSELTHLEDLMQTLIKEQASMEEEVKQKADFLEKEKEKLHALYTKCVALEHGLDLACEKYDRKIKVQRENKERLEDITKRMDAYKRDLLLKEAVWDKKQGKASTLESSISYEHVQKAEIARQDAHEILTQVRLDLEQSHMLLAMQESQYKECEERLRSYREKERIIIREIAQDEEKLHTEIPEAIRIAEETLASCKEDLAVLKHKKEEAYTSYEKAKQKIAELVQEEQLLRRYFQEVQKKHVDKRTQLVRAEYDSAKATELARDIGYTILEAGQIQKAGDLPEWMEQKQMLEEKIVKLGPINPQAIQEYEESLAKYQFQKEQQQDLMEAKLQLEKIIEEIDGAMATQFAEVFEEVSLGFQRIFKELFEGGKAELVLTDANSVLEAGIDMRIQPPGKTLKPLSLLSGGERALTVIALLFAFLEYRPAPFTVLDEVDAALDEANVERFSRFVRTLSSDTQFIVVTHRKPTMESAEVLHGVTMMEQGISQMLSVSFTEG